MRVFEKLGLLALWMCLFLVLTGGFRFRSEHFVFELASVDVFGALLLICLIVFLIKFKSGFLPTWNNSLSRKLLQIFKRFEMRATTGLRLATYLGVVFGLLFLAHAFRHAVFLTHLYDMALQHQALYFPFFEKPLHCDMCMQRTLLGEHLDWTWFLLSPLAIFFQSDILLFAVQAFLVALAIWIFFRFGPLQDQKKHWFWILVLFLLFRPLREGVIWDFREDILGFLFLTCGLTALWNKKLFLSASFVVLALLSKESFPLIVLLLIPVTYFDRSFPISKKQRQGYSFLLLLLGGTSLFLNSKFFIPHFLGSFEGTSPILRRFPGFGNTMTEFMQNVLKNPFRFLLVFSQNFFRRRCFVYFVTIFLPFILLGRRALIWLLPPFFIVLLYMFSAVDGQTSGSNHYEFIFLPFLWMAASLGYLQIKDRAGSDRAQNALIWSLCFSLCLFGRSPVFEVTDYLFHRGNLIRASYEMSFWKINDPIAASALTISHFSNYAHLRYLRTPEGNPPGDRLQALKALVDINPRTAPTDLLQDISDSKTFVIDREIPWEHWLEEELLLQHHGLATQQATLFDGTKRFLAIEVPGNFLREVCDLEKICTP